MEKWMRTESVAIYCCGNKEEDVVISRTEVKIGTRRHRQTLNWQLEADEVILCAWLVSDPLD